MALIVHWPMDYYGMDDFTERDLYAEAGRRLYDDAAFRYRAEVTARAMHLLRADDKLKPPRNLLEDDRFIAAVALVVAEKVLPGAAEV